MKSLIQLKIIRKIKEIKKIFHLKVKSYKIRPKNKSIDSKNKGIQDNIDSS